MDVSEQKAATKNFLRSMTQQQQERQMEEALVRPRNQRNEPACFKGEMLIKGGRGRGRRTDNLERKLHSYR